MNEILKKLEIEFKEYCQRNNLHPSPRVMGWWLFEVEELLKKLSTEKKSELEK